ncbi:MAG: hypothetical protein ABSD02_17660, partial [Steroidobacteraceae bacterium]
RKASKICKMMMIVLVICYRNRTKTLPDPADLAAIRPDFQSCLKSLERNCAGKWPITYVSEIKRSQIADCRS